MYGFSSFFLLTRYISYFHLEIQCMRVKNNWYIFNQKFGYWQQICLERALFLMLRLFKTMVNKEKYSKGRKIRSPALELEPKIPNVLHTWHNKPKILRQTLKKLSKNEKTFFNSRFYLCPVNLSTCSSGELLIWLS